MKGKIDSFMKAFRMAENIPESFLGTGTWKTIRERIRG